MSRFNVTAFKQDLGVLVGRLVTHQEAAAVRRDLQRHQTLAEAACNGSLTPRQEANERGVEARLRAFFGPRLAQFSGDPRGATVKLVPWERDEPAFTYFGRDWGGNLIFTGYRR